MCTFKTIINHIVLVSLLVFGLEVYALSISEDAIETESLRITLKDDNTGFIQGKLCEECKLLTVKISAETKAFNRNKEVSLKQAAERLGKSATVFINTEHTRVTRITW